ncbi:MAG: hypothetical protein ACRC2T_03135, partial [Thermoguttaceae bacterium]
MKTHWDEIDTASLLQLVSFRKTNSRFGQLLRHYWIPATELTYKRTTTQNNGVNIETVTRKMTGCDADKCTWREKTESQNENTGQLIRFTTPSEKEQLCTYNRSSQTFCQQDVISNEQCYANGRVAAFLNVPILTPLLPIPLGFTWFVESENGYMEFTLKSQTQIGDMPVIIISRKGEITVDAYFQNGKKHKTNTKIHREGVTAYATDRFMILEDRTCDTVLETDVPMLQNLETTTVLKLKKSELKEPQSLTPLYIKYKTGSHDYLFDNKTGHIIETDSDINEIIDDYLVLTPDEIKEKHATLVQEKVDTAIQEIDSLRADGCLVGHNPSELSHIDMVLCDKKLRNLGEFWKSTCTLLIIGITERCNLCCSYCCFSGKFAGQRTHSDRSISFETAKKAIIEFLESDNTAEDAYPISFYGGEPLVEFELLKQCVEFAKEYAKPLGKKARFAV